jgi:predicted enzyme related to lactoylglutathione lyase
VAIEYPPGTPSWVDLSSPDPDASAGFYGELFGWTAREAGSGYRIFTLGGDSVGGLAPAQEGQPPHWTTYVAVADADATQSKVEAAGGRTLFGPIDVGGAGRMALFADGAGGALFGIWQPGYNRGAQVVNAPGALTMNELDTRDPDGAKRFYGEVFGWVVQPVAEQDGKLVYASLKLDGRLIGGLLPMDENFPAEVPANWLAYFGVDDLDATRARARELGGSVRVERVDVPAGSFSVLADPHGAVFAILQGAFDPPPPG